MSRKVSVQREQQLILRTLLLRKQQLLLRTIANPKILGGGGGGLGRFCRSHPPYL